MTGSPIKQVNGVYQYCKDKKVNQVLNSMTIEDHSSFGTYNSGLYGSSFGTNIESFTQLSEDQLQIIVDFEEEQQRLGNFDRIYPLASNVVHYSKFYEHTRPSNELLAKYLLKSSSLH